MKKRILSIILAICMMITLVPMIGAENNEADINYSGYYVCGSELINNGAGNGITSLNRMTKVAPNVYEFTAYNVPACENKGFVFVKPGSHYITGKHYEDLFEGTMKSVPEGGVPEDEYIEVNSQYDWADITYRLEFVYDEDLCCILPFCQFSIEESHEHIFSDWHINKNNHYKTCDVSGCEQIFFTEAHSYVTKHENGRWFVECPVCGTDFYGSDYTADSGKTPVLQSFDDKYTYNELDLGATYSPDATTFKVWSPNAQSVTVNLFTKGSDGEEGADEVGSYEMNYDKTTGVWSVYIEGDMNNTYYTYTVTQAKDVTSNSVTTKETPDPYAVAAGINGDRSMVCDLDSTDPVGWENDSHVFVDKVTDSLVWELNIKDFSYDASSGVSLAGRGKYLAFTESGATLNGGSNVSTGIDYLKELGVTTVKLNPFYDFDFLDESKSKDLYDNENIPKNFNVPEGSYSTNAYDGDVRITECKQMIQALHNAGISVVMDVDYTHVSSFGNSAFQATVPGYYFRYTADGGFSNGSGYFNDLATERAMYRNFIIQSLLYWVDEYHIDGFSFNSTGLMDVETVNMIRDELDSVDSRIVTWGNEQYIGNSSHPSKTCTGQNYLPVTAENADKLNSNFAFYNNAFSTGIKGFESNNEDLGFAQGKASAAPLVKNGLTAHPLSGEISVTVDPAQTISYASCKNGLTLYDKIISSATDAEYGRRTPDAVKINKLAGSIVYMSQGIPLMLAGEEMCRSREGRIGGLNSADTSKINWNNILTYGDVISYYKGLMQIRKHFSPLTCADDTYRNAFVFNDSIANSTNQIAYTISNNTPGEWSKMAVIFNSADTAAEVTLRDTSTTEWVVIANGSSAGVTKLDEVSGSTFSVPAYSALIAVDKNSYESVAIKENTGKVTVNYFYEDLKTKLADSAVLQGTIGTTYQTVSNPEVTDKYYILKAVTYNATGKFTQEDIVVNYIYECPSIYAVGNGKGNWLNGVSGSIDSRNLMTAVSPQVYEITFNDVEATGNEPYDFSFHTNNLIGDYWSGTYYGSGIETTAEYKPTYCITFPVHNDHSTVTLRLDLTEYDIYTNRGATFTVTVSEAHDHDFSGDWAYDETYHWHNCLNGDCTEIQDKAMHTGGTATCISKAKCDYCDAEYGELDSSNHSLKFISAKDATATESGNKAYYVCDGCHLWFEDANGETEITDKDSVVIPPLGEPDDPDPTDPTDPSEDEEESISELLKAYIDISIRLFKAIFKVCINWIKGLFA